MANAVFGRRIALVCVASVTVAGCTVGPDFEQPKPWWQPASWFQGRPGAANVARGTQPSIPVPDAIDPQWWKVFGDPELTNLEQRVAAANFDVRVATVRLAESRASLGIARADLFPTVNGNTSYTREKQSKNGVISLLSGGNPGTASNGLGGTTAGIPPTSSSSSSSTSALYTPFNLYQYGFDATWEIDFWGRVRRNVESSKAQAAQSEEQRRNTLLTSLAELARDYIQLRGTQRQLQITQENLETDRQSLTLTQQRAAGGLTTDLDVANAAAQVATTAAQLPTYEEQQSQLINAISLLLGEAPNAMLVELATPKPIPPVPPRVPIGVPSEIARRRPDVRQAEAQLHSATADVGVAVADFFPQVTLSGSLALQTISASSLADWESRTYSLGPQITLPIFQGGKLRRTLELRQTQQQEAALNYQRTVLQALHDVDNALTSYENEQRRNAQLAEAVTQNQKAVALSRDRYTQGISDFLSVLDAERSLLAAQTQLTTSTTTISTNLVQLYKALGGGWEQDYPEAAPDAGGAEQSAGL